VEASFDAFVRPVRLLAAGGTIAMRGRRAVPALDAAALVEAVPALGSIPDFGAQTVLSSPGPHLELGQALDVARQASGLAGEGAGVVITTGTDTLEELAVLCAFLTVGDAPVVLTGASRPATRAPTARQTLLTLSPWRAQTPAPASARWSSLAERSTRR
jgi:L-asparaginase